MNTLIETVLTQMDNFTPQERAELAYALLLSLKTEDQSGEASFEQELSRRVARIRSGQATGRPAEEVFAELRQARS